MKKYAEIHKEYQNVSLLWVNVTGKEYISYNPTTAFVSLLKDGYISCLHFKTELKSWTPNDSKPRMALSFSKKENTQHY